MSTKPKAYAYSRISSRAQLKGDGLRRQLAAALEWSANNPDVEFDPTFQDHGVSAYRGTHRDTGKLGVLRSPVPNPLWWIGRTSRGSERRGGVIS